MVKETHGRPYFLHEWGKHVWDVADAYPVESQMLKLPRAKQWLLLMRVSFACTLTA